MSSVNVFAPAKINLALHVTGQREDGYHLLESLVVFGDIGDEISVSPASHLGLTISGPMARGVPVDGHNLVLRAAHLLRKLRGVEDGADIHLVKNLPHGAGLGGGSADAAATLHALAALWDVTPLTNDEALPLGADVPVCMDAPAPCLIYGIGEIVRPAPDLPPFWLVLVNPSVHVSTPQVFEILDDMMGVDNPPLDPMQDVSSFHGFAMWLLEQHNHLTPCTAEIAPEIGQVLAAFWGIEAVEDCDMSGSGSTCWALFETQDDAGAAAQTIAADHPDWWIKTVAIK